MNWSYAWIQKGWTFYLASKEFIPNTTAFFATGTAGHEINTGPKKIGESEKIS